MHNYLLTIAYDGTAYSGWQRQDGFDTIQERVEAALLTIFGEAITVHGAGRTDAGVHALRQCAHVRVPRAMTPDRLRGALNGNLPQDIVVREIRAVPPEFHARFSAVGKRYCYRWVTGRTRPVFARDRATWERRRLDLGAMRAGAAALIGTHDFASFATNPGYERRRGTVRTVRRLRLVRRPHGLDLMIEGDGFLYNMVRAIAGTLRDVGVGKMGPARVAEILNARQRCAAGMTADACGLYLVRVLYPAFEPIPGGVPEDALTTKAKSE